MAARIHGSRLEIFSGAGHGVFRDKPTEGLAVIRDFALATDNRTTAPTGQLAAPEINGVGAGG